jgi:hypothetical protein
MQSVGLQIFLRVYSDGCCLKNLSNCDYFFNLKNEPEVRRRVPAGQVATRPRWP